MNAAGDRDPIQIVDAALAEASARSGAWLVCHPGCTECCIGPFAISQLDAQRLRRGLAELDVADPQRAGRVRERARDAVARLAADFPGDPATGLLTEDAASQERFEDFADDEPCPALDLTTGRCDLYSARPMTCRTFGPPVHCGSEAVGICELCFQGASDEEIADCEVEIDPDGLEVTLNAEIEKETGTQGQTIVAFVLAS